MDPEGETLGSREGGREGGRGRGRECKRMKKINDEGGKEGGRERRRERTYLAATSLLAGPLNQEKAGGREQPSETGREDVPSGDELADRASGTREGGR